MIVKRKVYVLGTKQVNFVNNETGERIEGLNVWYFDPENPEGTHGHVPIKTFVRNLTSDLYRHGTGIYTLEFEVQFSGSKPTLKIKDFKFEKKAMLLLKDS